MRRGQLFKSTEVHRNPRGVVAFVWILWALVGAAWPQPGAIASQAAATPSVVDAERLHLLEQKIDAIRKAYVANDFQQVLQLCSQAEALDPQNPSVQLYREWARQKLQTTKLNEHADVEKSELPRRREAMTPAGGASPAGSPTGMQPATVTPPVGHSSEVAHAQEPPAVGGLGSRKNILVGLLLGGVGVIAGFVLLRRLVVAKRQAGLAPREANPSGRAVASAEKELEQGAEPEMRIRGAALRGISNLEPVESAGTTAAAAEAVPGLKLGAGGLGLSGTTSLSSFGVPAASPPNTEPPASESPSSIEPPPVTESRPWAAAAQAPEKQVVPPEPASPTSAPASIPSFEELGINIPVSEPEEPAKPPRTYKASLEESRIVITPTGESREKGPARGVEVSVQETPHQEAAPSPIAAPRGAAKEEIPVISLEDLVPPTIGQPPARPEAPAQASPELALNLDTLETVAGEPQSPEVVASTEQGPAARDSMSVSLEDVGDEELDGLTSVASPAAPPCSEAPGDVGGVSEEASTIVLTPSAAIDRQVPKPSADEELSETKTLVPPSASRVNPKESDASLAETKILEENVFPARSDSAQQPARNEQEGPAAPPPAHPDVAPSPRDKRTADERSERMFREQWDRGLRAFQEQNYKQAVHFFSIAAAIHPENEEVRAKLREARELKRQQESGNA